MTSWWPPTGSSGWSPDMKRVDRAASSPGESCRAQRRATVRTSRARSRTPSRRSTSRSPIAMSCSPTTARCPGSPSWRSACSTSGWARAPAGQRRKTTTSRSGLSGGGFSIHYRPEVAVTHMAWRSRRQLRVLRWRYGRGQGGFLAKHASLRDGTHSVVSRAVSLVRAVAPSAWHGGAIPRPSTMRFSARDSSSVSWSGSSAAPAASRR